MSRRAPEVVGRRVAPGAAVPGDFTYSLVEAAPDRWPGVERRETKRLRTRLRDGLIGKSKHRLLAQCSIKDRTSTGARLQLDQAQPLPATFVLTDGAARAIYRASLVWQDGREAGVELTRIDE